MEKRYRLEIKLEEIMRRENISVKELSCSSGVSKSEIYHICRNEKNPTLYVMLILAASMRVGLDELYEFKENFHHSGILY